jgi:hypothetical protein
MNIKLRWGTNWLYGHSTFDLDSGGYSGGPVCVSIITSYYLLALTVQGSPSLAFW